MRLVGFPWLMRGVGIFSLLYCLLLLALERSTPEPRSAGAQVSQATLSIVLSA